MSDNLKRVLIVEDEVFVSDLYASALKKLGVECDVAGNGEAALKFLKDNEYGLVLLDIIMPKMNGFDFLKKIRGEEKLKNLSVIVLSNLGQEQDRQICVGQGACEFFVKTQITQEQILDTIKKHLNL